MAGPYVAGLSVLADDEADLGAAVVDMGAGTTSIAVFIGGRFIHVDGFTLGGRHVTTDLARGLNARSPTPSGSRRLWQRARRRIRRARHDHRPPISDDEREPPQFVPRAALVQSSSRASRKSRNGARPARGFAVCRRAARARVLTGGAVPAHRPAGSRRPHSRPPGPYRPAARHFRMPDAAKGAAFAVAAGLLVYPQAAHLEHFEPRRRRYLMTGTGGYFARVGQWLRESF